MAPIIPGPEQTRPPLYVLHLACLYFCMILIHCPISVPGAMSRPCSHGVYSLPDTSLGPHIWQLLDRYCCCDFVCNKNPSIPASSVSVPVLCCKCKRKI